MTKIIFSWLLITKDFCHFVLFSFFHAKQSSSFLFFFFFFFCASSAIYSSGSSLSSVNEGGGGGASQTRIICGAPAPSLPPTKTYLRFCHAFLCHEHLIRSSSHFHSRKRTSHRPYPIFFFFLMGLLPWHCRLHFRLSHFAYPCPLQLVISSVWYNKLMFSGFSLEHSLVGEKRVNQPLRRLRARLTCAECRGGTAIDTYF